MGTAARATFGYFFMHEACQCEWRIDYSTARQAAHFNNVRLYPLAVTPNLSRLPRLFIKHVPAGVSAACATHYTNRASRNDVSNVGTLEVGSYSTHVPNSCLKWYRIHILALIHSPLYMAHTTLRSVVNF